MASLPWTAGDPAAMAGRGLSDGGGEDGPYGRAALGYDHGYDGEVFYLGLALDPAYVERFVEGCLERMGEDDPEEERLFRDLWQDGTQREEVVESLKADCEITLVVASPLVSAPTNGALGCYVGPATWSTSWCQKSFSPPSSRNTSRAT